MDDLSSALQTAVELELSTLPPYLCGLWSIQDSSSPAADLIGQIVLEEMLHLGLVCNMLVAVGGSPRLVSRMPKYPGPLPGGVRPDLKKVYLSGLTKDSVGVFMQIEWPEGDPVAADHPNYPTIGAFYTELATAFLLKNPSLDTKRQLEYKVYDNGVVRVLKTVSDVTSAISEIKEQGEGTSRSPKSPGPGDEKAHYYSFGEIYHEHYLVEVTPEVWDWKGPSLPFPSTHPMAEVPAGGWPRPNSHVRDQLNQFNERFTELLVQLEDAWGSGGLASLKGAVNTMYKLENLAIPLMTTNRRPPAKGTYGPEFRAVT